MGISVRMFNVILIGFTFMLVFTAFQTGGLIQQTVLKSIQNETNGEYTGDGYWSFCIIYAVFAVSNWIAPSIIALMSPRVSMLVGAITYNFFISQFLYPTAEGLYIASALVGSGAAVIWTGQGTFLTKNSTKETMSRNSAIFWAMMQLSLIWGNIFVYFVLVGKEHIDKETRILVYGGLLAVGIIGNLLMICFRRPPQDNDDEEEEKKTLFVSGIVNSFALLKTSKMLLLSIAFIYTGLELSFFSGVYSTAIGFTMEFGDDSSKYVPISGLLIGTGEVLSGLAFSIFDDYTKRMGRSKIVLMGFVVHVATFGLAFINLPANSVHGKTKDNGIIHSSIELALLCSFLLGFGDGCFNTQIYSLIGYVYSKDSSSAFGLFKFMQSIAAAAFFFLSTILILPYQLGVLLVSASLGTICFMCVSGHAPESDEEESDSNHVSMQRSECEE
ncbi:UNC93-like protein MFSD11 isoform X2 [Varroa destructor]|uniref:UNC93-like protein MFSD11 n=1 Tax=Varroa destructor TaxID=109461 RepID=A0A7M7KGK4_VARDE|nr:UNC93-like protein MFSD11 isoform X2 [Varroa destructor]